MRFYFAPDGGRGRGDARNVSVAIIFFLRE